MIELIKESGIPLLPTRPPATVMDINRLGSMHQCRLSFMRSLMRKVMREKWSIKPSVIKLDDHGYGVIVYRVDTGKNIYSFVLFSNHLDDDKRNDRVIAEEWDVTMTLCIGDVTRDDIDQMRENVPKQEGGRVNSKMIVLSRGNKSSRNFDYVVSELSSGHQPDKQMLTKVGYLYRTTAVYGSGKFGMADWEKVKQTCPEFATPFSAEMFVCFMLRHFSIDQAERLASIQSPSTAVAMDDDIKRYIGIGNSTGLGMAPFLIRHPKLISRWLWVREQALARISTFGDVNRDKVNKLVKIFVKAQKHLEETEVPDEIQTKRNDVLKSELAQVIAFLPDFSCANQRWDTFVEHIGTHFSFETQEVVSSSLMELYPDLVDDLEDNLTVDEHYRLQPAMTLSELKQIIEVSYDWALEIDFSTKDANHFFWYFSEEKMEPRLGDRYNEPGEDKEMPLIIGRLVRDCYNKLMDDVVEYSPNEMIAYFLLRRPELSGIVTRIQAMSAEPMGEIRGNLADINMRPLDLLRCKLSFFGVSKFDPKSKLWVRNTMFQGAPIVSDIGKTYHDDWYFPVASGV